MDRARRKLGTSVFSGQLLSRVHVHVYFLVVSLCTLDFVCVRVCVLKVMCWIASGIMCVVVSANSL